MWKAYSCMTFKSDFSADKWPARPKKRWMMIAEAAHTRLMTVFLARAFLALISTCLVNTRHKEPEASNKRTPQFIL